MLLLNGLWICIFKASPTPHTHFLINWLVIPLLSITNRLVEMHLLFPLVADNSKDRNFASGDGDDEEDPSENN